MIKEAIDRILGLSAPTVEYYNERPYADRPLVPIKEPLDSPEDVGTLSGLVRLVQSGINAIAPDACFAIVESPTLVTVNSLQCNAWGDRQVFVRCKLPEYGHFEFGRYLEQEEFMVGLQAFFVREPQGTDNEYVIRIAGKLSAQDIKQADDDGMSQTATIRTGVVLAADVTVKKLVRLRPYRTFREVEQPASEFVFRLRSRKDQIPSLALHVADGDMWQAEAMQNIKKYLETALPTLTIVA